MLKQFATAFLLAAAFAAPHAHAAEEPTYTVGSGATYRPFEYENPQREIVGFDIDVIKAIGAAEHFKVKVINTPWEGIFATLEHGDRDMIMSGITITDQRRKVVDFSHPYFPAEQIIVAPSDSKIDSLASLKSLKVGVVASSTGDISVSGVLGKTNPSIKRFDSTPLMLEDLSGGGVDAAVGDVGVIKFYVKSHPDKHFKLVKDASFKQQYFGIAVKKGNQDLLDKINAGLAKIVADGTYAKIYANWFDSDVPTLPAQ
ncbi:basic amino acid ABC transporter substrate-binding protein [uncultured Castellaniella sp.]|uniref:basic amino acid ABC transporter substrate-binding protein n=1 Tax=uncultured Castellaniella sp. TaxID=647907 RepID=UPI00260641F5|nr:basic amino acid ABC transporter substrate-binding protein [uncultured Castellaniella sp.]